MQEPKFHWFDERLYGRRTPICGHASSEAARCSHKSDVTCGHCLKKLPVLEAMPESDFTEYA